MTDSIAVADGSLVLEAAAPAELRTPTLSSPRIALVGNPNCGKTALFNALTGSRQKVANYPGVTVERKEGFCSSPAGRSVRILDLPGTYSLRARSPDEEITRDVVLGRRPGEPRPDLVIFVADATNLKLNLRLVLELRKTGLPIILALNMFDLAQHRGYQIAPEALAAALGVPVVTTVAVRRGGIKLLLAQIDASAAGLEATATATPACAWSEPNAKDLRAYHREIDAILASAEIISGRPPTLTDRVDTVLLHPVFGLAILGLILFLMFQAVFAWAQVPMDLIDAGFVSLQRLIAEVMPEGLLRSLIADGIIAGVGSVVIFLPQIVILFLFILLLEDSGYMARTAFLLDRLMGGAGLHGRAFIPLLSSFACAIPGILAARTIENRTDRLTTIMIAPLVTCSARLPVYTLIIAAFIPDTKVLGPLGLQGLVMFSLYVIGVLAALIVAAVLKRSVLKGVRQPLLMELPPYRLPRPANIAIGLMERASMFLKRAGTTIFCLMIVIWVLATFPGAPAGATEPAINYSLAGILGSWLAPLLAPVGFTWEIAVSLIPGMAAREVVVAALGTVYALSDSGDALAQSLSAVLSQRWSLPTALSLLAWFVFAPQCASTLGVVRRETQSWQWPAVMFAYMLVLAYAAAYATFHLATALLAG